MGHYGSGDEDSIVDDGSVLSLGPSDVQRGDGFLLHGQTSSSSRGWTEGEARTSFSTTTRGVGAAVDTTEGRLTDTVRHLTRTVDGLKASIADMEARQKRALEEARQAQKAHTQELADLVHLLRQVRRPDDARRDETRGNQRSQHDETI